MERRCVVNFSNGRYIRGQDRLVDSLKNVGYDGGILLETIESNIPFASHEEINYGFKAGMIQKAREMGYDLILWADAAVYAGKNLDPVFNYIDENGYFIFHYGEGCVSSGEWCCDSALKELGITREESYKIPHIFATTFGINLKKHGDFFDKYLELARRGISFNGSWHNTMKECSCEERVQGHRHDQTVMSVLLWQMGLTNWIKEDERLTKWFNHYRTPGDAILIQHPI